MKFLNLTARSRPSVIRYFDQSCEVFSPSEYDQQHTRLLTMKQKQTQEKYQYELEQQNVTVG